MYSCGSGHLHHTEFPFSEEGKLNFVHNPQNQQFRENETVNSILKEINNLSDELLIISTVKWVISLSGHMA